MGEDEADRQDRMDDDKQPWPQLHVWYYQTRLEDEILISVDWRFHCLDCMPDVESGIRVLKIRD